MLKSVANKDHEAVKTWREVCGCYIGTDYDSPNIIFATSLHGNFPPLMELAKC